MNMHADEKSDEAIRAEKRPNNGGLPPAEAAEQRASPKGNGRQTAAARTLCRSPASNELAAVRQAAQRNKQTRFTALLHHITVDLLKQSFRALERNAAPGIDGATWYAYQEQNLEEKLKDLHGRIHRGSYRARPAKRSYIPKADGTQRPLDILCLEDKIVQQAVVYVLEAIYEADFLGFSYGYKTCRDHQGGPGGTRGKTPRHCEGAGTYSPDHPVSAKSIECLRKRIRAIAAQPGSVRGESVSAMRGRSGQSKPMLDKAVPVGPWVHTALADESMGDSSP